MATLPTMSLRAPPDLHPLLRRLAKALRDDLAMVQQVEAIIGGPADMAGPADGWRRTVEEAVSTLARRLNAIEAQLPAATRPDRADRADESDILAAFAQRVLKAARSCRPHRPGWVYAPDVMLPLGIDGPRAGAIFVGNLRAAHRANLLRLDDVAADWPYIDVGGGGGHGR